MHELLGKHYRKDHIDRIKICNTYDELYNVAIDILKAMPQPIGIVCGPITSGGKGSIEKNIEFFKDTICDLTEKGHHIFSQMQFEDKMQMLKSRYGATKEESINMLFNDFYKRIFESGYITTFYFLPGWQSSYGAKWERKEAERLGMEIIDL